MTTPHPARRNVPANIGSGSDGPIQAVCSLNIATRARRAGRPTPLEASQLDNRVNCPGQEVPTE
jgi:hypothetical protein